MPLKNWLTRKEDTACPKLEASDCYCADVTRRVGFYMQNKSDTSETVYTQTHACI